MQNKQTKLILYLTTTKPLPHTAPIRLFNNLYKFSNKYFG